MAERAKSDRMSGRELFMSDASLFVDDEECVDDYAREDESRAAEKANDQSSKGQASASTSAGDNGKAPSIPEDDDDDVDIDDDDELELDELNELEASLASTSIHIQEP
ncbi:hypothetical protein ACFE04_003317 [Oxalis oulophora]